MAIKKEDLEKAIEAGHTEREIAVLMNVSRSTVRHLLKKFELKTKPIRKKSLAIEEKKKASCDCPHCGETFKNVYSMSAHKGHCLGLNSAKHFDGKRDWSKGKTFFDANFRKSIPDICDVFKKHNEKITNHKRRNWVLNLFDCNHCMECGLFSEWNNRPISLEVHHIDGDNKNDVITNLQVLCPNCHSQTWNFRKKNNEQEYFKPKSTFADYLINDFDKSKIKDEKFLENFEKLILNCYNDNTFPYSNR